MQVSNRMAGATASSAACRRPARLIAALLLALAINAQAHAQRTPLACQGDEAAGLNWKDGQWRITRFLTSKFILVQEGSSITEESAAKALNMSTSNLKCGSGYMGWITCNNELGSFIFFNPASREGALAKLLGATVTMDGHRDSVLVQPFTCQPF
jgi:hypothetical protein